MITKIKPSSPKYEKMASGLVLSNLILKIPKFRFYYSLEQFSRWPNVVRGWDFSTLYLVCLPRMQLRSPWHWGHRSKPLCNMNRKINYSISQVKYTRAGDIGSTSFLVFDVFKLQKQAVPKMRNCGTRNVKSLRNKKTNIRNGCAMKN